MEFVLADRADRAARELGVREVEALLTGSEPNLLRLGVIDERDGAPVVHPVWFIYEDEKFLVATDSDGVKARSARKDPRVYFLVDVDSRPPRGVRGKGTAKVIDDPGYATEVTRRCVMKYLGTAGSRTAKKILAMGPGSCVLEITPEYMATWKY